MTFDFIDTHDDNSQAAAQQPEVKKARGYAFKLLAGRDYPRQQLAQKIQQKVKGISQQAIDYVLEELTEDNWLSDERYAQGQIRMKSEQGQGPIKINYKLRQAGVASSVIDQAFEEVAPDWLALAMRAREKKFGEEIPSDYTLLTKQKRFLQARGYSMSVINRVFIHSQEID